MRDLDLIFFSGNDIISEIVEDGESLEYRENPMRRFSHVGLIISKNILPFIPQLEDGKYYIWESCVITSGPKDVETKKHRYGVQIRDLIDVVSTYEGRISIGVMNIPYDEKNVVTILSEIHELF